MSCKDIGEDPQHDEQNDAAEENWPPHHTTDRFHDPLRPSDFLLFAFVKLRDGFNVLGDRIWRLCGCIHVVERNLNGATLALLRTGRVPGISGLAPRSIPHTATSHD